MPTAISSGMTKRSDSRIGLVHTHVSQGVPRRVGIRRVNFEYCTAPYQPGGTMRYVSRSMAMLAALLVLGVSIASAQHPQTRKGFWIGFGFGYGSYTCTDCSSVGSVSGYLKMGGTVSPHLLLGGETNGWTKSEGGETLTAGNASFAGYYYPQPAGGLFLRGGVGFSTISGSSGGSAARQNGGGGAGGFGY